MEAATAQQSEFALLRRAGRKSVKPPSSAKGLAPLPDTVLQNLINEPTAAAPQPLTVFTETKN